MITIEQCRAARGLLDWTQQDLAEASGLSKTAINNFEKGHSDIKNESLKALHMAFESADVEFIGMEGVRKKSETARILKGPTAFNALLDDIFATLKDNGGEILLSCIDENFIDSVTHQKFLEHLAQLKKLNITERAICTQSMIGTLNNLGMNCRGLDNAAIKSRITAIVYGPKVAFELWGNSFIVVLESADAVRAERQRFEFLWASVAKDSQSFTAPGNVYTRGR